MKKNILSLLVLSITFLTISSMEQSEIKNSKQVTILRATKLKKLEVSPLPLENISGDNYRPCNPSICPLEERYMTICRTVNYELDLKRRPATLPLDGTNSMKTKNILVQYDQDFNKLKETPIVSDMDKATIFINRQGLEDYRIFNWDNELWFLATTYDTGTQGIPKKVLGKIKDIESNPIELDNLIIIDRPCPKGGEKNWLPFIKQNKLWAIYSFDPLTIFQIEKDGTYQEIVKKEPSSLNMATFKGSASPISFGDGYLAMIHETIVTDDDAHYFHRFVYLDENLTIKKVSDKFSFMGENIEFVCGMTIHNDELVIGLGVWDKEAYLYFINIDSVNSLLYPLDN